MQADPNCVFCKIVSGEIPDYRYWENDNFVAFLDIRPIALGHSLVVPKIHVDHVFDLPADIYRGLFEAGKELAPAVKSATGSVRVGMAVEGFGVAHTHLHLIPIWKGNEMDPHRAHEVPKEDLVSMQSKIKSVINQS